MSPIRSSQAPSSGGQHLPELAGKTTRHFELWVVLLCTTMVALVACSRDSLWIDEAWMALVASEKSLSGWWRMLRETSGSSLQMPLYTLYLWGWEKLAGHNEVTLRLGNLPWVLLAHYSLYRACARTKVNPLPLLVVASLNPFLWFYLNEARPYLMQYAGSCVVIWALNEISENDDFSLPSAWLFSLGLVLLAGSSMLGMAWAACAIAAGFYPLISSGRSLSSKLFLPLISSLLTLLLLACYYFWTLDNGARGSSVGKMGLANLLYVVFELFGFAGLGPGRLELREEQLSAFRAYLLPLSCLFGVVIVILAATQSVIRDPSQRQKLQAGLIYALPAAIAVTLLGFVANFRLLGRHFTPLAPLVCIVLTIGLARICKTRWRILAAAFLLLWSYSSFSLRFAARHQKDDYRAAAGAARAAITAGKTVWWAADRAAAKYYGVALDSPHLRLVANASPEDLEGFQAPDLVVLSKHDIYDASGPLVSYLRTKNFKIAQVLPAFTVWQP